ncbi:MAG TPA: hypothetical protein VFK38_08065 [Candidatus Limnocylindrales bacterium]|nr:hypothetical protein [Candidatus Limnocylindrales bacterium]
MVPIECPWCESTLAVEAHLESALECPECHTRVELADEPAKRRVAAAA